MADPTWMSEKPPVVLRPEGFDWVQVVMRGLALSLLLAAGLALMLVLRVVERPLFGERRPWTPHITVFVCRSALRFMGIGYLAHGLRMDKPGAVVANHSSWLDILALNAGERVYFVSKSEVAGWPGIGWLARATGTLFITRDRGAAAAQKAAVEARLAAGHKLLFFPEGTSTDGLRVLPFKPTLFAALFSDSLKDVLWVQPVTLVYHAPEGVAPEFYGWWGEMDFGSHLLAVLARGRHGRVEVFWHAPVRVADFGDRKALAKAAELAVAGSHPSAR